MHDATRQFPIVIIAIFGLSLCEMPVRAAAPALGDYLRACGIGNKDFARFSDDRQMADEELDAVRRMAVRLRDCPADALRRMMAQETISATADAKYKRGQIVTFRGRIESVEQVEDSLSRCTLASDTLPHRAVVYVGQIAKEPNVNEQVAVNAVFVKYVPGVQDRTVPIAVAGRLLHRAAGPLGELDFDAELFEGALDRAPLAAADSAAFYRLLELTKSADSPRLQRKAGALDPVAAASLYRDPAGARGRLLRVAGAARRAVRVPIDDPATAAQLGADHYFQIDLAVPALQDNAMVFCTLELPPGMPLGGPRSYSQPVDVTGFFVKMWQYPTGMTAAERAEHPGAAQALQNVPLLLGPAPRWEPVKNTKVDSLGWGSGGILALAITGLGLLLWSLRQSDLEFSLRNQL